MKKTIILLLFSFGSVAHGQSVMQDSLAILKFTYSDSLSKHDFYYILSDNELFNGDYFLNYNFNAFSQATKETLEELERLRSSCPNEYLDVSELQFPNLYLLEQRKGYSIDLSVGRILACYIIFPISGYIPNPYNAQMKQGFGLEIIRCESMSKELVLLDSGQQAIIDNLIAHRFQIVGFVKSEFMFYYNLH